MDRGPRPLADALEEALSRLVPSDVGRPAPGAVSAVFGRWEEIVGPSLARHVRPVRLAGGVLVVAVDRPPWATQVRALGPGLLARVGEVCGAPPDRIEVVVRPRSDGPGRPPDRGAVE